MLDMPLLLSARATTASPIDLLTSAETRLLRIDTSSPRLIRVRRGVYADREEYQGLTGAKRYAVRVHAFVRAHPDAILCLESAAVVLGLPSFGETRDIHMYSPERRRSRRFGDVVVHTSQDARRVERIDGVRVTSMLDTVADLARVLPPARAIAVVDSAIAPAQGGMLTLDELRAHVRPQVNRRGILRLEWTWDNASALSESPPESLSRVVIDWNGFETPILQQVFHYEGFEDRADFYFEGSRTIGESDGWQKYELDEPVKAAKHLADEKRREDRLRRHRHPFARWDQADAWRSTPLRNALLAAGVEIVRPAQTEMLRTLSDRSRDVPFAPHPPAPPGPSRW
ncbi:hypothetical protein [Microbacterium sp.]|uniref:hypothetical protein n=1 Tax=Microbacterium sp. TaxID=51671 RepID=UPI0039E38326